MSRAFSSQHVHTLSHRQGDILCLVAGHRTLSLFPAQVPLIGFIGRLDFQKGADLVLAASHWLLAQDVQLVCLGTGDQSLEVRWDRLLYTCHGAGHANGFRLWAVCWPRFGLAPPPGPRDAVFCRVSYGVGTASRCIELAATKCCIICDCF